MSWIPVEDLQPGDLVALQPSEWLVQGNIGFRASELNSTHGLVLGTKHDTYADLVWITILVDTVVVTVVRLPGTHFEVVTK